ncbi:hypothetical protein PHLCEN_2v9121 [Hermanssonia centrifuga]|uniref:Uncharacterized protein n=1 Tax=Hermanssonia centrifuga TaxID=98765 RepID=A0A2R6NRP4_9APHY|nr:hypothetical protein PHLCEN_2v9121 [Hermanssonia centrifuga]
MDMAIPGARPSEYTSCFRFQTVMFMCGLVWRTLSRSGKDDRHCWSPLESMRSASVDLSKALQNSSNVHLLTNSSYSSARRISLRSSADVEAEIYPAVLLGEGMNLEQEHPVQSVAHRFIPRPSHHLGCNLLIEPPINCHVWRRIIET